MESGRGWLKPKREGGLLGQAKVVEAPWGPAHGWHLHLHLLRVFDHRNEKRAGHAAEQMEAHWIEEVTARGFGALQVGQRFEPCYDVAGAAGSIESTATQAPPGGAALARPWRDGPATGASAEVETGSGLDTTCLLNNAFQIAVHLVRPQRARQTNSIALLSIG